AQPFIAEVLTGKNIDLHKSLVIAHEVERSFGREDHIQALCEGPKKTHELKAEILVIEQIEKRVMVSQVREAILVKEIHDCGVTGAQFTQFLFRKTQYV